MFVLEIFRMVTEGRVEEIPIAGSHGETVLQLWTNPNVNQLETAFRRARENSLRGFASNSRLILWDSSLATHWHAKDYLRDYGIAAAGWQYSIGIAPQIFADGKLWVRKRSLRHPNAEEHIRANPAILRLYGKPPIIEVIG